MKANLLYENDLHGWALEQSELLKKRDFSKLDIDHLIEELQDLGESNKTAIESHLIILMMHMLKQTLQPEKASKSWNDSIENARAQIEHIIEKNPSLKNYPSQVYMKCYPSALRRAAKQMGKDTYHMPSYSPWSIKDILGE